MTKFQFVVKTYEWTYSGTHFISNMDWDLNQCCRICAQTTSALISIFGEEGLFRQLMSKLRYCLQIIVLENDDLPTAICWKCVSKLEVCFELMQEHLRGQYLFETQMARQQVPLDWKQTEVKMEYGDQEQLTVVEQEEHVYDTHEGSTSSYGGLPLLAEVIDKNRDVSDASGSGPSHVTSDEDKSSNLEVDVVSKNEANKGDTPVSGRKKRVSCEFCGKVFNHTGDLNKHRRKHTGERPYPCPQCHKQFSHASNLIRHQKIHSGETPHQCPTCARRFSRKDKMVNHMKNSHSAPPETYTST
ncbi:zinc finger protein 184-like isoform X2 [Zootermopsis nevadensis]|uniref:zinc finger protein 184-like isoform X2 n=1 Tax=Zootermopsis nevadensis TaxID=136037 RepID=UPI000B8E49AC|nr:zinc finger protein 184-like isoform X2 [Zootermopsis nevadensis]